MCVWGGLQVESPVATAWRTIDGRSVTVTHPKLCDVAKRDSQLQVDGSCSNEVVVFDDVRSPVSILEDSSLMHGGERSMKETLTLTFKV